MRSRSKASPGFYRQMLALAIPIALQNMLTSCGSLIDTAMVARLGNVATTAVGIGAKCVMLIQMVTFGFCSGGSVLIAQYWGAKDQKGVRRAYCIGLWMCMAAAALFTAAALLLPDRLIRIFTDEEAVCRAGTEYLRIVALGVLPCAFANMASMARRSVEEVRLPLISSAVAVAVNCTLNYALIYGQLGLPKLGLPGAAVATAISQLVQALLMLGAGILQKHFTVLGALDLRQISAGFFKKYLRIAMPVVCNESIWGLLFNAYSMIYARQGSANYAAYTLYSSIESLVFVFFIGACNACSILIGKTIGQGRKEESQHIAAQTLRIFVAMGLVLGGTLACFRWPLIRLLGVEDPVTAQLTANILLFYCCWCPLRQLNYVLVVGILRAGGDTKVSALLDVGVMAVWSVPVVWYLTYVLKLPFLWCVCGGFIAEDVVKLPLCLWRLKSGKWIRVLAEPQSGSAL